VLLGSSESFAGHPVFMPALISGNTEHIVEALAKQKISLGSSRPARSREVKTKPFS